MTRGSVLDRPPPAGPVLGVVLPDLDGSLRRPTLDAAEDALRLAFRVAGWTAVGREARAATSADDTPDVVVETRDPDHHALAALVRWDAELFWSAEEALRAPLALPPTRWAIRLVGIDADLSNEVRRGLAPGDRVVGPLPLPEGRNAVLVLCEDRGATLEALRPLRDTMSRRGAELRVDVDPIDLG
jgi:primosomal protein N'